MVKTCYMCHSSALCLSPCLCSTPIWSHPSSLSSFYPAWSPTQLSQALCFNFPPVLPGPPHSAHSFTCSSSFLSVCYWMCWPVAHLWTLVWFWTSDFLLTQWTSEWMSRVNILIFIWTTVGHLAYHSHLWTAISGVSHFVWHLLSTFLTHIVQLKTFLHLAVLHLSPLVEVRRHLWPCLWQQCRDIDKLRSLIICFL